MKKKISPLKKPEPENIRASNWILEWFTQTVAFSFSVGQPIDELIILSLYILIEFLQVKGTGQVVLTITSYIELRLSCEFPAAFSWFICQG